jgi:uncharacterized protein YndB with AHSA1/START domain
MLGTSCLCARTFAGWTRARPEVIWSALTDADKTASFLYGLAAHSTWLPGAPIAFRHGDRVELTGRVLHARRHERLSYVLHSGPDDPCVYLTWLIRPAPDGCTIRLEIDEAGHPDSREDAEDVWLLVLDALQQLVNPPIGADDD